MIILVKSDAVWHQLQEKKESVSNCSCIIIYATTNNSKANEMQIKMAPFLLYLCLKT